MATTTVGPDVSRAAGAVVPVLRRPASPVVGEASQSPTPLFTRHTLGVIEAERDRRLQRRARGAVAYRGSARERTATALHPRIAAAVAGNARAVTQARRDMDRWVDEGGMVPFRAAATLRASTTRR